MQRMSGARRHCPMLVIELERDMSSEPNTARSKHSLVRERTPSDGSTGTDLRLSGLRTLFLSLGYMG